MFDWFLSQDGIDRVIFLTCLTSGLMFFATGIILWLKRNRRSSFRRNQIGVFSPFGLFCFLCVSSLGALLAYSLSAISWASLVLGIFAGAVETLACIRLFNKLRQIYQGHDAVCPVVLTDLIGKTGIVHQTVPPRNLGDGAVRVGVDGETHTFEAIHLQSAPLMTGTMVRITQVQDDKLVVEAIDEKR